MATNAAAISMFVAFKYGTILHDNVPSQIEGKLRSHHVSRGATTCDNDRERVYLSGRALSGISKSSRISGVI